MAELREGCGWPQHLQNLTKTFLVSSKATCSKVFPTRTLTGRVSQSSGGSALSRRGCGDRTATAWAEQCQRHVGPQCRLGQGYVPVLPFGPHLPLCCHPSSVCLHGSSLLPPLPIANPQILKPGSRNNSKPTSGVHCTTIILGLEPTAHVSPQGRICQCWLAPCAPSPSPCRPAPPG